jgi:hypothetical protein
MKPRIIVPVAVTAIWLGSPALNVQYVQWELGGSSQTFICAVAIWAISTFTMVLAFRLSDPTAKIIVILPLVTILCLVSLETLFWLTLDADNNKPMLLRQSIGTKAGFILAVLGLFAASWPGPALHSEWPFARCARLIGGVVAGTVGLELALFAVRAIFRRTPGYYAMDNVRSCGTLRSYPHSRLVPILPRSPRKGWSVRSPALERAMIRDTRRLATTVFGDDQIPAKSAQCYVGWMNMNAGCQR